MMSVFEYAMDVEKTVEEILKKCKELQIDATNEEDMLDEDAITELDNVLAQEPTEEDYDEIDEMEDELIEKEKTKIEGIVFNSKAKKNNTNNVKSSKKELARKKKEMYKHKEKLISNAPVEDKNVVIYKDGMTIGNLAKELNITAEELINIDSKKLETNGLNFQVAQVNTVAIEDVLKNQKEIELNENIFIQNGKFYFISDSFIEKYGSKYNLMKNKETGTKRPCYFCFMDKTDKHIIWFVPISKQYTKYKTIYEKKRQKLHREPLNFVFGIVKNEQAVFLIQNMFPTTEEYIEEKYQVKNNDITISKPLQKEIIEKAENVLRLESKGIHISFSNLIDLKKELDENHF